MTCTLCFNARIRKFGVESPQFFTNTQAAVKRSFARVQFLSSAATLLFVSFVLAGCTTIPERELVAYRKAFDEVKTQSANVLADYAASRQAKSNLVSRVVSRRSATAGTGPLDAQLNLQAYDARIVGAGVESDIDARLKAWAVAARYNEALTALATGRSSEIAFAASGLLDSLKKFPIKDVSQAAAEAVPYAGAIIPILELVQKEVEARRFRQAVLEASPLLDKFVEALYRDANLFREHRATFLNYRFKFEEESFVVEEAMEFRRLLNSRPWSATNEVADLVGKVNAARILVTGGQSFPEIKINPSSGTGPSSTEDIELLALKTVADRVQTHAKKTARATASELQAYHEMMVNYARLLQAFEHTFKQLRDAAANGGRFPDISQLETIISSARVAYIVYTQTK